MFDAKQFINESIQLIREKIKGKALIACSGGVDSTVAAVLVDKAIGKNLIALHVDTGLMRKNESQQVKKLLEDLSLNTRFVDASERFFNALKGIIDPEKKRKIIGELFIRIFEEVAEEEE
ncbi:MAG: 7-cyano-7-deazaguanine synthase, partial [Thermoplasmata archaeon]|nr:7-cyano-7-deazaguanine synthase [Thermoplasmata archaeon]